MIQHIDDGLERFLRASVPLPAAVDVSFATPDRRWSSTVTNPTVNLFLWEIVGDPERSTLGLEERVVDGRVQRRPHPAAVDLRYVVTCWASHHRDEHQLLGAVLRTIVASSSLPREHLPSELDELSTIGLLLGSALDRKPGEFWSSLDGQLKPSLELTVVVGLERQPWETAGPPTTSVAVSATPPSTAPPAPPGPAANGRPPMRRRREGSSVVSEAAPEQDG